MLTYSRFCGDGLHICQLHCMKVLSCIQVKSICKERLSLVKNADTKSGPDNISANYPTFSSSETTDSDLTTNDGTNSVARKYYEVCFRRC